MKNVIAFSLWGNNPVYTIGALRNAELAEKVYPGWACWFYVGKSVPRKIVKSLQKKSNCRVIEVDEEGDWDAMFWRFLPAGDPDVDVMISRDCDSRLWFREKAAVDEWLESDKLFHIMRDNAQHTTPILGGMWGVRGDKLKDIASYIKDFHRSKNYWQMDQEFLRDIVYPLVREDSVVHDEFFEKNPFPYPRDEKHFVGQAYDGNGKILDDDEHFEEFTERDLNGTR
tara:strand:- start:162 stop:842 length:681 start_codon:yes stop_codon:yes gene_type:complete